MPASVAGAHCARAAFLLLHKPWYGALLWQHDGDDLRVCCQYDHGRRGWELPKGGQELGRRASSGVPDSSPFATARHELWEEAGVWLAWRPPGADDWVTQSGAPLPGGPGPQQNAYILTELRTEDEQAEPGGMRALTARGPSARRSQAPDRRTTLHPSRLRRGSGVETLGAAAHSRIQDEAERLLSLIDKSCPCCPR